MELDFEWDDVKAEANLRKHNVSFEEAASVFGDPMVLAVSDLEHSDREPRWKLTGTSEKSRVLVVVYARRSERVRIISARRPSMREVREYVAAQD